MFDICKGVDFEEVGLIVKLFQCNCCICVVLMNFLCKMNKFEFCRNMNESVRCRIQVVEVIGKEMILNSVCEIGWFIGFGGFGIVYEVILEGKKLVVKKMY